MSCPRSEGHPLTQLNLDWKRFNSKTSKPLLPPNRRGPGREQIKGDVARETEDTFLEKVNVISPHLNLLSPYRTERLKRLNQLYSY